MTKITRIQDRIEIIAGLWLTASPWVLGYAKHVYDEHPWQYLDLDLAQRSAR